MLGATSMDMTGAGGIGDIWSTGVFSYESPLKDLLDSGDFTLEQLLAEDELLQELRGCHQQLMVYFSTEAAVTKLVQYVIQPNNAQSMASSSAEVNTESEPTESSENGVTKPQPEGEDVVSRDVATKVPTAADKTGDWLTQHLENQKSGTKSKNPENDPALKHIRFPYMACEIICCEIPGVTDTLVDGHCTFEKDGASKEDSDLQTDTTEIVTSESQNDMVEVVAKQQPKTSNTKLLDLLFSLLHDTPAGELDDYRAGYFDKILTVLSRKRPDELTTYINTGGAMGREVLMQSMLKHVYAHSVMQIAQRLLLPRRPVEPSQQEQQNQDGDEIISGDEDDGEGVVQCDWGETPEVLNMLLDLLIGPERGPIPLEDSKNEQLLDLSLNASEVLITIIQNSMLSSPTMLSLTSIETVTRIIGAATTLSGDYFSPHESLLTSAMNVLESLILQLGGYGAVGTMSLMAEEELALQQQMQGNEMAELFEEDPVEVEAAGTTTPPDATVPFESAIVGEDELENEDSGDPMISDLGSMLELLPLLLGNLSQLLRHSSTTQWTSPMQFSKEQPMQLLGNSRLRIVRVLESLVLLGDPDVDLRLVQSDCLEICLDFFWDFQWCSMLHQSVANLLVHVFEGQNTRFEMQEYFLVKCDLLGRLMDSFMEDESTQMHNGLPSSDAMNTEERIINVVENLQEVAPGCTTISPGNEKAEVASDAPLPVSEDDVDAAIETQEGNSFTPESEQEVDSVGAHAQNAGLLSTEAVRFESRDVSTVGDVNTSPPPQAFRFGYMGHVIIICQALVHAYTNEPQEQEMLEGEVSENALANGGFGIIQEGGYLDQKDSFEHDDDKGTNQDQQMYQSEDEPIGSRDDFGEPLLLFEIVHTHALAERWHEFVDTTLAAETAVQSTPLGGYSMQAPGMDALVSHRPGLADEGHMMGDDGEGPPAPPRGMLGGGDVIDMDDNDLDIAASMIAGLRLGRTGNGEVDDDNSNSESVNSGDSEKSYNSGETASEKSGYAFDDPLGKAGELGIELGKLTKSTPKSGRGAQNVEKTHEVDEDDRSHSSSEEEPESLPANDVPVMDLFTGNFDQTQDSPTFANFADFESASQNENVATTGTTDASLFAEESGKVDIDEIFGSGDHAELLEQDDVIQPRNPFSDSTFQSAESTDLTDDIFGASVATTVEVVYAATSVDTTPASETEKEDITTAPSDELLADSKKEDSATSQQKNDTTDIETEADLNSIPEVGA